MYTAPGGEIIVSDSSAGSVYVLTDKNKSYKDPERKKILDGLTGRTGWLNWKDYLYVGERTSIKRHKYDAKAMTATAGQEIASLKISRKDTGPAACSSTPRARSCTWESARVPM